MQSKYTTKELIKRYTKKNKSFVWGVETVIDSLTHNVEYKLDAKEGVYVLNKWELAQPTSEEIKEEYIRQYTIADCLEYFKEKTLLGRLKKLFKINKN
jgi:hypothetical protein|tara:strand:- start:653 stop:946 length:294 start_codon:yes stop_codon:yes gene_type:complete